MRDLDKNDWKLPAYGKYCPTPIDWARMAAFIDGEGSILINSRRNTKHATQQAGYYLRVTVANTEMSLIFWLYRTFGGSYHETNSEKYKTVIPNSKTCYHWNTASARAAWILHNCMPYFIIKTQQAELGIQLQESMNKFTRGPGKSLPQTIIDERKSIKRNLLIMKARTNSMPEDQQKRIDEVS